MPHSLYVAVLETRGFVVGSANAPSGLHRRDGAGAWTHLGWRNVRSSGLSFAPADPSTCFMACGNGVFRTRDGGETWRVTTGWDVTEVQDVAVDPRDPERVYAATAYGMWRSDDGGARWVAASTGIPAPRGSFLQVVEADAHRPGLVMAGGEDGLFRSLDAGRRWEAAGPRVPVRDLRRHPAAPDLWLAGTEGYGVLLSRDGGATWAFAGAADLGTETIYAVAFDPAEPDRMAAAGFRTNVLVSTDGASSWAAFAGTLPEPTVHALAFEPGGAGRLWAGTVGAGVYFADDAGGGWTHAGLDGAAIHDMTFVRADVTNRNAAAAGTPGTAPGTAPAPVPGTAWGTAPAPVPGTAWGTAPATAPATAPGTAPATALGTAPARAPGTAPGTASGTAPARASAPAPGTAPASGFAGYDARREALIDFFADRKPGDYLDRVCLIEVAAKLYRRRDLDRALDLLDRMLADPHGDMFWMYPMVLVQYVGRGVLPVAVRQRMRERWRSYTPYRGDTENHWAMYYASLYLITQLYPDDGPEAWFNGRSSRENFEEARDYLLHWMDLTTTSGQGEYDSPHYMGFFITPMALLFAFADDDAMKLRAQMMIDYLIADFAAESLNGLYAGAFSRIYPEPTLERWKNSSTSFAWLLFGNVPFRPHGVNVILPRVGYRPHGIAVILAMSGYRLPEILHHVATDRSAPYVHRELKRTRNRIRYSDARNLPVYKYMRMRAEYALGSTQGGLLQPIQQHTWELLWATSDPLEGFNVLFTVHPYSSSHELAMYFPEEPKLLTEAVLKAEKPTYDAPDKWTGGSPFEQVFQHEDTLIALYDIPAGTRFPHIDAFFSRTLLRRETGETGWIFARGGDALIAYYPLAPYQWREEAGGDLRLHSANLKNGAVVQVAPAAAFASFEAFAEAVRQLPLVVETTPLPLVDFRTLGGDHLEVAYGSVPRVNGAEVDYAGWPLFEGPFVDAARGSRRIQLRHGRQRRLLDFEYLTIEDRRED